MSVRCILERALGEDLLLALVQSQTIQCMETGGSNSLWLFLSVFVTEIA